MCSLQNQNQFEHIHTHIHTHSDIHTHARTYTHIRILADTYSMEENEGMMHWCALAEDEEIAVSVIDCLCDLGAEV